MTAATNARKGVWRHALSSTLQSDWTTIEPLTALRCALGVGIPLVFALMADRPGAGMFMAVGAVSAGFASFDRSPALAAKVMLWAAAAMAAALTLGSLAGHGALVSVLIAAVAGFVAGMFVAVGPAASFVALQAAIAILVAGAYPAGPTDAALRGVLVLVGGLAQILLLGLVRLTKTRPARVNVAGAYHGLARKAARLASIELRGPIEDALRILQANLTTASPVFHHAIRLGAAIGAATFIYRWAELPRGYWFPMTTLIVLRPEFRETFTRGVSRIAGTLAGAALATALVTTFGAHPGMVIALLIAFVWAGYLLFRANYTLFTVCITGYVVLLLYLASAPGPLAAEYRALNTVLGGVLALAMYRVWPTRRFLWTRRLAEADIGT